jgi:tRNA A-37 threonylcarbamoyl transferase component Bud32
LLEELARGGMGVVYRARDPDTHREVAVKVLLSPHPDPRFHQEARMLRRLDHEGIVRFHEVDTDEAGRDYLVMELVEGESLRARLRREGPLSPDEAVGLTLQLCDALGHAHAQGVLHRDLKPDNVLVSGSGQVKLTDFGLGKLVDWRSLSEAQAESLTQDGDVLGTPAYMPPEQASGDKAAIGQRSDVFGLGATLYALLTGRAPFEGTTVINVINAVLTTTPAPPSERQEGVPSHLDAIVARCLARDPADRYPSVGELAAALRGEAGPAPARVAQRRVGPRSRDSRAAPWVAAGVLLTGLGVAVATLTRGHEARPGATPAVVPADEASNVSAEEQAEAHVQRGHAHARQGALDAALVDYSAALELAPSSVEALEARARVRAARGDPAGAIRDVSRALELDPLRSDLRLERGLLTAPFNVDRALEDLSSALADEAGLSVEDQARGRFERGKLRRGRGDRRGALEDFERAEELVENDEAVWEAELLRAELEAEGSGRRP